MKNMTFIPPSSTPAEGCYLSLGNRQAIDVYIDQVEAIVWLMGNVHTADIGRDTANPAPELVNAAFVVSDLMERIRGLCDGGSHD
jgi:hypothetical protein